MDQSEEESPAQRVNIFVTHDVWYIRGYAFSMIIHACFSKGILGPNKKVAVLLGSSPRYTSGLATKL